MSDLVTVIWRGPFTAELATGRTVEPGGQMEIPKHQLASAHFELVKPARTPKPEPERTED